ASALVNLSERMETRIVSWLEPTRLRIRHYVGFVRVGDLQLEILPKLDATPDRAGVRRQLLAMLSETRDLDVRPSDIVDYLHSEEPFIGVLARLYCRRLLEAVRLG